MNKSGSGAVALMLHKAMEEDKTPERTLIKFGFAVMILFLGIFLGGEATEDSGIKTIPHLAIGLGIFIPSILNKITFNFGLNAFTASLLFLTQLLYAVSLVQFGEYLINKIKTTLTKKQTGGLRL